MNKKRIFILTVVLCIMVIALPTALAATTVENIDSQTPIDGNYGFSFKWIDGVTTAVPLNMPNDEGCLSIRKEEMKVNTVCTTLSDSVKGRSGIRYNNVGSYNGTDVDLKVTVTDWTSLNPKEDNESFYALTSNIAFYISRIDNIKLKFQFLKHGTDTPLNIKGYITLDDLDYNQYFEFDTSSAIVKQYLAEGNNFITYSNKRFQSKYEEVNNQGNGKLDGLVMTMFKGNYMELVFGEKAEDDHRASGAYFGFTADVLGRFTLPEPSKSVNKKEVLDTEKFEYTVSQLVPHSAESDYYNSFTFKDTINSYLVAPTSNQITVTNELKQNVTSKFNISVSGQTITAEALKTELEKQDFYEHTYTFKFPVYLSPSAPNNLFVDNGKYQVKNFGNFLRTTKTKATQETSQTNEVTTDIKRKATIKYVVVGATPPADLTDKLPADETKYIGDSYEIKPGLTTTYKDQKCTFNGWYKEEALKNKANGSYVLEGDTTLYGAWTCANTVVVPKTAAQTPLIILGVGLLSVATGIGFYIRKTKKKNN